MFLKDRFDQNAPQLNLIEPIYAHMYKQIYTDKSPPESLNTRIDYYTESEQRDK